VPVEKQVPVPLGVDSRVMPAGEGEQARSRVKPQGKGMSERGTTAVEHLDGGLLDDVPLKHRVDDEPSGPEGKNGAERDVEPVKLQPIPIRTPISHGKPTGEVHALHVVTVHMPTGPTMLGLVVSVGRAMPGLAMPAGQVMFAG
jgi:hypothetical protein